MERTNNDQVSVNSKQFLSMFESMDDLMVNMNELLVSIYELDKKKYDKNYEIFFLTYPDDGTRATFPVGTTILDFAAGTIKSPDGSIDKMSSDLRKQKKDSMRSFAINCDQDTVVQLDTKNKSPVRANTWGKMTYQQFTKVRVTTTVATTGYIHACTNPEAIHEQIGEATIAVGKQTVKHIDTDKDTHFTTAIAQNAIEPENIIGLSDNNITITGIAFQAKEALDYRLWIYDTDGFADTDLDADQFNEYVDFDLSTNQGRIAGAGQYYFAQTGLSIDYEDEDATKELHIALQNLSAASKTAGADGAVKMKISYKPRL